MRVTVTYVQRHSGCCAGSIDGLTTVTDQAFLPRLTFKLYKAGQTIVFNDETRRCSACELPSSVSLARVLIQSLKPSATQNALLPPSPSSYPRNWPSTWAACPVSDD